MNDYEIAQGYLDRAYLAVTKMQRETRPEYVEFWRGHALSWASLAEQVGVDVVEDGVAEVRELCSPT